MKAMMVPIPLILLTAFLGSVMGCGTTPQDDDVRTTTEATQSSPEISDSEILEAVKSALQQDSSLATANIAVTVQDRVVTLRGRVRDAPTYIRAISKARSAAGFPALRVLATDLTY